MQTDYDWVAFVRRRRIDCGHRTDDVLVIVAEISVRDAVAGRLRGGGLVEGTPALEELLREALEAFLDAADEVQVFDTLTYPHDSWEYPGSSAALRLDALSFSLGGAATRLSGVVGLAALTLTEGRRPLGALRAQLFAESFPVQPAHLPVFAVQDARFGQDAIVVFVLQVGDRDHVAPSDAGEPVVLAGGADVPAPATEATAAAEAGAAAPARRVAKKTVGRPKTS